jgi:hypothetical protein
MLNIYKLIQSRYKKIFTSEKIEEQANNYFLNAGSDAIVKQSYTRKFDPDKPNRLLKFFIGKDYYKFPDF